MDGQVRWWVSFMSIAPSASTYLSFLSFTLLGFYVTASHNRYISGMQLWASSLRLTLHTLVTQFRNYFPAEGIHKHDHLRIMGHIISLPIVLKQEVKQSRDVRDLTKFLPSQDVLDILNARSMSRHVVNDIRSYFVRIAMRPDTYSTAEWGAIQPGNFSLTLRIDVLVLMKRVVTYFPPK